MSALREVPIDLELPAPGGMPSSLLALLEGVLTSHFSRSGFDTSGGDQSGGCSHASLMLSALALQAVQVRSVPLLRRDQRQDERRANHVPSPRLSA